MLITKKKHNKIVDDMQKKIDCVTNEKIMLEAFFRDMFKIQNKWSKNKIGNRKAMTKINEMFQFKGDK